MYQTELWVPPPLSFMITARTRMFRLSSQSFKAERFLKYFGSQKI